MRIGAARSLFPVLGIALVAAAFLLGGMAHAQVKAATAASRNATPARPSTGTPAPDAPAPLCAPVPLAHRFSPGEKLVFRLDVYGADVGTFEIWLDPPPHEERDKVAMVGHARAHTSAFVSTNLGNYTAFATSRMGPGLTPISSREEVDDAGTHWLHEMTFPAALGKLAVHASKNGEGQPIALLATPSARDLLSAFLSVRGAPLAQGTAICEEVFAGRRMWKMSGTVGGHETIESPVGKFDTVRVDVITSRIDDPKVVRAAHFWITDDARRLPVAAIAEVKGKVLRAQLYGASAKGWSLGQQSN